MKPLLAVLIAALALAASVNAQPVADHLKCYKVKDSAPKASYTADLGGLVAEPGCIIKVPAAMACVPATKTNVQPPPPGTGGTGTPNAFGCYKIKCPKAMLPALQLNDQFGSRSVTPSTPKLLCAPVAAPGSTTTTTVTTTTKTTTTTHTTTTTIAPTCANGGIACGQPCGGSQCPGGICIEPGTSTCSAGVHCGSSQRVCVSNTGTLGSCTTDADCPPLGFPVCLAAPGACASGHCTGTLCTE